MASETVRVGRQGRVVIPADVRRALAIEAGAHLALRVEGGRIILEPRDKVVERLRRRFAEVPDDVDLVAELQAERREEALRETEEG